MTSGLSLAIPRSMSELSELKVLGEKIRRFCEERDWDQFHAAKDLAIGLVTESSELLAEFRFLDPDQSRALLAAPEGREAVGQELADVLFFLLRFADRFDFDLAKELNAKMELNAKKYPADEFRGRNHKYNRKPVGK
jgi:NTP pyrophosphatase (non-canonical NTP hydrolase)